jgi:hypothetical protein
MCLSVGQGMQTRGQDARLCVCVCVCVCASSQDDKEAERRVDMRLSCIGMKRSNHKYTWLGR